MNSATRLAFLTLQALDVLTTFGVWWAASGDPGIEANPVARAVLCGAGWPGMVGFKAVGVLGVLYLLDQADDGTANQLASWGCGLLTAICLVNLANFAHLMGWH